MRVALRCAHCGNIAWSDQESVFIEIDFKEKQIRHLCPQQNCGKENILDFKNWDEVSSRSGLPQMKFAR